MAPNALTRFSFRLGLDVAGDHDRHGGQISFAHCLQHLVAVHDRHVEIQEDDIALTGRNRLQCLHAVAGEVQLDIPVFRQRVRNLLACEARVVTDQQRGGHWLVRLTRPDANRDVFG
jgi:hypothetical protein